jgi:hypothetical protein
MILENYCQFSSTGICWVRFKSVTGGSLFMDFRRARALGGVGEAPLFMTHAMARDTGRQPSS